MQVVEAIRTRRSIRKFRTGEIPLEELLEVAKWAPSAGNLQDWVVYATKDKKKKRLLAEACLGQRWVEEAPLVLVICSDLKKVSWYGERGKELYSIQDTACFAYALMLVAWEKGVGSCWIGAFDEKLVREIMKIPEHHKPLIILLLGIPAEDPPAPPREKVKVFWR